MDRARAKDAYKSAHDPFIIFRYLVRHDLHLSNVNSLLRSFIPDPPEEQQLNTAHNRKEERKKRGIPGYLIMGNSPIVLQVVYFVGALSPCSDSVSTPVAMTSTCHLYLGIADLKEQSRNSACA